MNHSAIVSLSARAKRAFELEAQLALLEGVLFHSVKRQNSINQRMRDCRSDLHDVNKSIAETRIQIDLIKKELIQNVGSA